MVNQSERVLLMRTQLDVAVYSRSSTRTILGGMPMEWRMCSVGGGHPFCFSCRVRSIVIFIEPGYCPCVD